jgi:hypothetical protein
MLTRIIAAAALVTLALSGSAFARAHAFTAHTTIKSSGNAARFIPQDPVRIKSYGNATRFIPQEPTRGVYKLGR